MDRRELNELGLIREATKTLAAILPSVLHVCFVRRGIVISVLQLLVDVGGPGDKLRHVGMQGVPESLDVHREVRSSEFTDTHLRE